MESERRKSRSCSVRSKPSADSAARAPEKKMPARPCRLMLSGEEVDLAKYQSQYEPLRSLRATRHCYCLRRLERIRNRPSNDGAACTHDGLGHFTWGEISSCNKAHKRAVATSCRSAQKVQAGNQGGKASLQYRRTPEPAADTAGIP